jgi:hypothetical protein
MKLLVNTPSNIQELITIQEGGSYFDLTRVVWDERVDGLLDPSIVPGGLVRQGNTLVIDAAQKTIHDDAVAARLASQQREETLDSVIASDTQIQQLKAMTSDEFDTWWSANVTTLAQANNVLKRIARVVIRRVL